MQKNAIVFMFDSLQADYLGCYGNDWVKTPNFDRFAREGVVFENAYAEGLPTIPVRRAMLTGRYTLPTAGWVPLSMEDTTIADLCWGRPIDTALIFDCPMYRQPKFGYTRGFDKVYFTHGHENDHQFYEKDPLYHFNSKDFMSDITVAGAKKQLGEATLKVQFGEIDAYLREIQHWRSPEDRWVAKTAKKAVQYLEEVDRNKQFFLWVDSFDPHEPWCGPSVYMNTPCPYDPDYDGKDDFLPFMGACDGMYSERELKHIRALYAEIVTLCDTWFGYFMDNVHRLGFDENTLVMVVSDHGEPLGYGKDGHGIVRKCRPWAYEELARIVFMVKGPGLPAGERVTAFTSSVDVAPTICQWLGIGVHPTMQGADILPLALGQIKQVRDYAISGYYKAGWALYTEDWSYMHWPLNAKAAPIMDDDAAKQMTSLMANNSGITLSEEQLEVTLAMSHKSMTGLDGISTKKLSESVEWKKHQAGATLDGEEQWTCTPGAAYITSEYDELYDRVADRYQLNNVADQYPEIAGNMLRQLKAIMEKLKNS